MSAVPSLCRRSVAADTRAAMVLATGSRSSSSGSKAKAKAKGLAKSQSGASVPRTPLAERVPKAAPTGNMAVDSEKAGLRRMFQEIIDHCIYDASHIMPLYSVLTERVEDAQKAGAGVDDV